MDQSQSVSTNCDNEDNESHQEVESSGSSGGETDGKLSADNIKPIQKNDSGIADAVGKQLVDKIIQWINGIFPRY